MKRLLLVFSILGLATSVAKADLFGGSNVSASSVSSTTLPSGSTNYIQNRSTLQTGATAFPDFLYVGSSMTVLGSYPLGLINVGGAIGIGIETVPGPSSFLVLGNDHRSTGVYPEIREAAGQQEITTYYGASQAKWAFGKQVDDSFIFADSINNTVNFALFHNDRVAVAAGLGGTYDITVSTSTVAPYHFDVTQNAHINAPIQSSSPTVSSCGTNPSVVGSDVAGTITLGSGGLTACTLAFASAYTNVPACVVSNNTTATTMALPFISTSSMTVTYSGSQASGKVYYICVGRD